MNDSAAFEGSGGAEEFLRTLGERIRVLRSRRGMSQKMLADAAGVSLRYLSDLENGAGNASVLLLRSVAQALDVPIEELVNEAGERSSEYVLLQERLRELSEDELAAARAALNRFFDPGHNPALRVERVALVGLRGAGKTTLGNKLAAQLGVPFVELNGAIEAKAGLRVGEIHSLYGQGGYRRLERQCLEELVARGTRLVLSTPGSLVSDAGTYNFLLSHFFTVWLRASPEEHMARVVAQGDLRPIAGHSEAMSDLRRILEGRAPFYAKADVNIDTSGKSIAASLQELAAAVRQAP